jgi:formiminotetrahydrofolate cyclodeaminase
MLVGSDHTQMSLVKQSVSELLAAVRSPNPTPGGGSAAALAGALGASLLAMVAGLPKSKAATEEDAQRLRAAGDRCTALAVDLERLVDVDSAAYELVMAAYKRPRATEEDKAARSAAIQAAFKEAIAAPSAVMRACAAAAEQGVVVARLGNPSAASDLQVGLGLLETALRGARLNVEVNLGSVKDADYVAQIQKDVTEFERAIGHEVAAARTALQRI